MRWTVLIPMRALPSAKSRLLVSLPADLHADVVEAIRADTLAAVLAARPVARIVVISDAAGAGVSLVQASPGLNGALRDGAEFAVQRWPGDGLAALVGDLPALQGIELAAALDAAARHPRSYVADASGTGTTLLTALPGTCLDPRFGVGSAARHAAVAAALDAGAGLRQDVDTAADLAAAALVGLGPRTAALVRTGKVLPHSP